MKRASCNGCMRDLNSGPKEFRVRHAAAMQPILNRRDMLTRYEILWWVLRYVGGNEWVVNVIKTMYSGATTAVKLKNGISQVFGVKVGVHKGSVFSPLLFNIMLEALSRKFRQGHAMGTSVCR
jgi:Reverse transcriptase (RNA-dependent DNA polymerase)